MQISTLKNAHGYLGQNETKAMHRITPVNRNNQSLGRRAQR